MGNVVYISLASTACGVASFFYGARTSWRMPTPTQGAPKEERENRLLNPPVLLYSKKLPDVGWALQVRPPGAAATSARRVGVLFGERQRSRRARQGCSLHALRRGAASSPKLKRQVGQPRTTQETTSKLGKDPFVTPQLKWPEQRSPEGGTPLETRAVKVDLAYPAYSAVAQLTDGLPWRRRSARSSALGRS